MGAFKGGSNWRGYVMGMVTMSPATVHRGKRSVLASKLVRSKYLNLFLLCNSGSQNVSSSETYLKPSQNRDLRKNSRNINEKDILINGAKRRERMQVLCLCKMHSNIIFNWKAI